MSPYLESQKTRKLPDGGEEISFRLTGLDEIKRWIPSFGPEATVLDPANLQKSVR